MPRKKSDVLSNLILNYLETHHGVTGRQIAHGLSKVTEEVAGKHWSERTVSNYLKTLSEEGKIKNQQHGYLIEREWKAGLPKAFILIEVTKGTEKWENHQKKLIDIIRDGFNRAEHENLRLISVDAVLGAEFSVIVQVYSDDLHYIGRFVKGYLLTSDLVKMTRTIMVWPTDPRE